MTNRRASGHMLMHRFIMSTPDGMDTDHKNGNTLDNRKANLRICTTSQNMMNTTKRNGSNTYKGVYKTRYGTFNARIKTMYLGTFVSEKDAAESYNQAAKKMFGEFAKLNIV
jgi:hypothetical protein